MNDDTITLTNDTILNITSNAGAQPVIGDIISDNNTYSVFTGNGFSPLTMASGSTISMTGFFNKEDFLEERIMNRVTIDHKVAGHELLKLKEVAPDYANEIKENLTKNVSRDIIKKVTFTKKLDKDADVHHFIGRVWVFTEDELKQLIEDARNA